MNKEPNSNESIFEWVPDINPQNERDEKWKTK
jgi:hypothetical protein